MTYEVKTLTSTVAPGASQTYEMRPGDVLTVVAPPNVKGTITETPLTIPATDTTSRLDPRVTTLDMIPATRNFGPYATGANVTVVNSSNSSATLSCVKTLSQTAAYSLDTSGNVTGLVGPDGGVVVTDNLLIREKQKGRPYPGFPDTGEWAGYGVGTGSLTEVSDPEHGRVLRFVTGIAGSKYGSGRNMVIDAKNPVAFSFLVKRDASLTALDVEIGYAQFGFTKYTKLNKGVSNQDIGQWQRVAFSLAEYEGIGGAPTSADLQDIRTIRISITPSAGNVTTLDIADFRVHAAPAGGQIAFAFDDARLDTYTVAYQIMKQYGQVGYIAVEYLAVGNANRCTQGQLNTMYANGWEMGAHHTNSFSAMSEDEQVTHHKGMRDYLNVNGFERGNHIFAYPGGQRNASTDKIARGYWQVMRAVSAMTQIAAPGAFDPVKAPHVYVGSSLTLAQAKERVDKVKAFGGSCVFVFHSIVDSITAGEDWLRTDFEALTAHIQAQNVPVVPLSSVWVKWPRNTAF